MPRLACSLLGPFQATIDAKQIRFESDTARALLSYLATESSSPHRRETLASLFWSDQNPDIALKNLRHTLYRLRQSLSETSPTTQPTEDPLVVTTQTVQLNPAADTSVDVSEFRSLLAKIASHKHRRLEACASCYARLAAAAQLYRGDLMAGFALADNTTYEEWLLVEREKLHIQVLDVLSTLTRLSSRLGDYPAALRYARQQIKLEPWREEAHVQAMQIFLHMNQRSAAVSQYAACRRALQEEFGVEPSPQTRALYDRIRNGQNIIADQTAPTRITFPNNLPAELTPFVGRKRELEQISNLLETLDCRLLTLVGPGGAGKTRISIQSARSQLAAFNDGVYFVPLGQLTGIGQITTAIAEAVGLNLNAREEARAQLRAFLAAKEMLIVLDNFEHLKEGTDLLALLLRDAPNLTLLVTSRELLGLSAEITFNIEGLAYPQADAHLSAEDIESYEAVQLFIERAQGADPDFQLSNRTAEGIAQLCEQVVGIPLGLELAAAWVQQFTPAEIAASIARNYDFLTSQFADMPEQHSSLRAVFNYSWNLLTENEQRMFSHLSVFRGGWNLDSAWKIAEVPGEVLDSLAAKSLIIVDPTGSDEPAASPNSDAEEPSTLGPRFSTHEMLRRYAAEQQSGHPLEETQLHQKHAYYFNELVEHLGPLTSKASGAAARSRVRKELANLDAALDWTISTHDQANALRLVAAMLDIWRKENLMAEGRKWSEAALTLKGTEEHSTLRAQVLNNAAAMARAQGDHDRATALLEECLAIRRELGDTFALAEALNTLGGVQMGRKNYEQAKSFYEEALLYLQDDEKFEQRCWVQANIGACWVGLKQPEKAIPLDLESIAGFEKLEDRFGLGYTYGALSDAIDKMGDFEQSAHYRHLSLQCLREVDNKPYLGLSLANYSNSLNKAGRSREAIPILKEALPIVWATGGPILRIQCLESAVRLAASFAQPRRAVLFLSALESLADAFNTKVCAEFMEALAPVTLTLKSTLTPEQWDSAYQEGSLWSLEKAWAEAKSLIANLEETLPGNSGTEAN